MGFERLVKLQLGSVYTLNVSVLKNILSSLVLNYNRTQCYLRGNKIKLYFFFYLLTEVKLNWVANFKSR